MKNTKKLFSLLIALVLVLSLYQPGIAADVFNAAVSFNQSSLAAGEMHATFAVAASASDNKIMSVN